MDILKILKEEFKLQERHIKNVIELLDDGNTIPFIARYRKEQTGEMQDSVIRDLSNRLEYLRNLESRKEEVKRLIDEQGKLDNKLKEEIEKAVTLQRVEDLYRPYKQKRRTRATIAKEKGLEKLADLILKQDLSLNEFEAQVLNFIDEEKEVSTREDAISGAIDIICELVADSPKYRELAKDIIWKNGLIISKKIEKEEKEDSVYEMYFEYSEGIKTIANHRILAINRGEKEKELRVNIHIEEENIISLIKKDMTENKESHLLEYIYLAIDDGYKRLLFPSIEREIRSNLSERAEEEAINVFSLNLKSLLMQPPLMNKVVLGIDPAFRTGCKLVVVDRFGKLLDYTTVYPTAPQNQVEKASKIIVDLIEKYKVDIIAIGNGTASRETESIIVDIIRGLDREVYYMIVNEAGASVYSASKVGIEEFPNLDVSIRGGVSIARRLQDPLAELVKIDPKHIGVGQYQHDLNQGKLNNALEGVIEDCVNTVGVDLNTASSSLLSYIAGISSKTAKAIVEYREENGEFKNRKELLKVKGLGPKAYQQCAGFLRIQDGDNPLDNTSVHPESYEVANKIYGKDYDKIDMKNLSEELSVGLPTLRDIIEELKKPGRDPRDNMPKPILRQDVLSIEDLKLDMVLKGTVRNVVDFGAFIDIGLKSDGLVHISQISKKFIKHPKEALKVGDIVDVKIIEIDNKKNRVGLSIREV